MAPWSRRPSGRVRIVGTRHLTAGAEPAPDANTQAGVTSQTRRRGGWQTKALAYYDSLGCVWYAGQFYAKPLSQVKLVVKRRDGNDLVDAPPEAAALLDRIQGPNQNGRSDLQGQYGALRFLTGECYLLVTAPGGVEQWEVVSIDECQVRGGNVFRYPNGLGLAPIEYRDVSADPGSVLGERDAIVYRMWKQHPRFSAIADSPMRANLVTCDEIYMLSLAVLSHASSRAARSGILAIPEEATFADPDPSDDTDAAQDPFVRELTESMLAPIANHGEAGGIVPIIMRMGGDYIEKIKLFELGKGAYEEKELRDEAIRRLAAGLDMPPETLLGTGDVNHWGSWLISEQEWTKHVKPVCEDLCADLTDLYLRPAAIAARVQYAEDIIVWYDESAVVVPADRTEDARQAYDRYAISAEALRREGGFEEHDAPSEDELVARIALDKGDATLLTTKKPAPVPAPFRPAAPAADGAPAAEADGTTPSVPQTQPDSADGVPAAQAASAASDLTYRCIAAAELVVDRAREKAGSAARAKHRGPEHVAVANTELCAALARQGVALHTDALVAGSGRTIEQRMLRWGVDDAHARMIVTLAERHAADTLLDDDPGELPDEVIAACGLAGLRAT